MTINPVAPGLVATDMTEKTPEKVLEKLKAQIPVGRAGRPDEIARVVHFLAADHSSLITGQVWGINGGQGMLPGVHAVCSDRRPVPNHAGRLGIRPHWSVLMRRVPCPHQASGSGADPNQEDEMQVDSCIRRCSFVATAVAVLASVVGVAAGSLGIVPAGAVVLGEFWLSGHDRR